MSAWKHPPSYPPTHRGNRGAFRSTMCRLKRAAQEGYGAQGPRWWFHEQAQNRELFPVGTFSHDRRRQSELFDCWRFIGVVTLFARFPSMAVCHSAQGPRSSDFPRLIQCVSPVRVCGRVLLVVAFAIPCIFGLPHSYKRSLSGDAPQARPFMGQARVWSGVAHRGAAVRGRLSL